LNGIVGENEIMMKRLVAAFAFLASISAFAQTVQVPSPKQGRPGEILPITRFRPRTEPYKPTAEELEQIRTKADRLGVMIRELQARRADDALLADVEIFHEAARWALVFPEEFSRRESVAATLEVLEQGMERAAQLKENKSPWTTQKGRLIRGYRSALDGSVQPFRLTIPEEYDGSRTIPLDVILHGRYLTRYEVEFISAFPRRGADRPHLPGTIQVELFGRGNNAYHWPGEADIFEAVAAVKRSYRIDPDRVGLRGFSMGGAGIWHTALHYPDLWATVEAGAGDNQSHRYPVLEDMAPHQRAMCHIFDNTFEWMLNAYNTPFIGYVGEIDGSFRKHVAARQQLTREGFHFEGESFTTGVRVVEAPRIMFFVAPNTPHATHPEFRKKMDEIHLENLTRGRQSPDRIRFLTYTTRYNRSYWATLDGLEKHYERAEIDARRSTDRKQYDIATKCLTRLVLRETGSAATLNVDGQTLHVRGAPEIVLEKSGGAWRQADAGQEPVLRTRHGLQGPIDDAFLEPFLIVRPTGTPWNPAAHKQAIQILDRFDRQYQLAFRGHLRVKDDKDLTEADLQNYHIVLFGDPGSNRWIGKLNGKLPIGWTRESIMVGRQSFRAAEALPAFIYPNPLSPAHYVVINSGLTAEWADWAGDFSTPQYGDFAVLRANGKDIPDVAYAGIFDEFWNLPGE
jgi:pimeloyl-ACP methyl ester carboxylesterase